MKFFPAEAAGGAAYLRAIHAPVPGARFCPTGGITPTNVWTHLGCPNVACVGGTWLTPADAVRRRDWGRICTLAALARQLTSPSISVPAGHP
ncbi:MAG: 2-dehydro-3-deoxyphosphogluconate aldolase / (4S)-4-hydroxy-2-oxoglutarate aldolase [Mycobacterium sp.]|jgi:2-dehydro-3-deoxyphosphogluconate aldolase/(4S)-4-hydroxy-2-oxoglutarate aldolase|nr:keto-deoxy-phosphogluconate aldolase [Mycobacterium sp.]MDT5131871.1 2-dehydro-3-deoxyphosphogluconate aldolase / (4S)-4-hydroxy-2-oxoglutarate aldolase [Mycobacterium sp.]